MSKIYINKLFNMYNYEIDLSAKCIILIGENGLGKSTILKILNCLVERNFIELAKYNFENITFSDSDIKIEYKDLFPSIDAIARRISEMLGFENALQGGWSWKGEHTLSEEEKYVNTLFESSSLAKEQLDNMAKYFGEIGFLKFLYCVYSNNHISKAQQDILDKLCFDFSMSYYQYISINDIGDALKQFVVKTKQSKYFNYSGILKKGCLEFLNKLFEYQSFYADMVEKYDFDSAKIEASYIADKNITRFALRDPLNKYGGRILLNKNTKWDISYIELINIIGDCQNVEMLKSCYKNISFEDIRSGYNFAKYQNNINIDIRNETHNANQHIYTYREQMLQEFLTTIKDNKSININKMLNDFIFEHDFVKEINLKAISYYYDLIGEKIVRKRVQTRNIHEQLDDLSKFNWLQIEHIDTNLEEAELLRKCDDFYIKHSADIAKYINPIILRDSIFDREFKVKEEYDQIDIAFMNFYLDEIHNVKSAISGKCKKYEKIIKKFLFNKHIEVRPNGLNIYNENGCEVDINNLSSGEKKIILLMFISVFLDDIIIFLDEPEISLSVIWQSWLLPFMLKSKKQKIFVATHSPYITDDEKVQEYIKPLYVNVLRGNNNG